MNGPTRPKFVFVRVGDTREQRPFFAKRTIMQALASYMRACLFCGAFWGRKDLLCSSCLQKVFQKIEESDFDIEGYPFPVKSLLCWSKGETRTWKSELLLAFKGGGCHETWRHFAQRFLRKSFFEDISDISFVPAPARREGEKDHAYRWAEALATVFGGDLFLGLRRVDQSEQKSKKLGDRRRQTLACREDFSKKSKAVFVDDLIASGSTAIAAFEALGRPKHFEVWTLAYRPSLLKKAPLAITRQCQ